MATGFRGAAHSGKEPEAARASIAEMGEDGAMPMPPSEIFELIVKADEKLKYATTDRGDTRRRQAVQLLTQARDEAREIGNEALIQQAELRLSDLGEPAG